MDLNCVIIDGCITGPVEERKLRGEDSGFLVKFTMVSKYGKGTRPLAIEVRMYHGNAERAIRWKLKTAIL